MFTRFRAFRCVITPLFCWCTFVISLYSFVYFCSVLFAFSSGTDSCFT